MKKNIKSLIKEYGAEEIIARIMEQLRIVADCEDEEVIKVVKELLKNTGCDTEYIYNLCEFTNLVTYTSEKVKVTESPWLEK